jgi:hypothetical protein
MGRTVPTYRMTLESVALRFAQFRRALRESDRRAFDRLVDRARAHSSAASYEASLEPAEVMFLSIVLDQELEIERLHQTLDELSWRILGRPAASAGTLEAYIVRKEDAPFLPPAPATPGAERVEGQFKVQEDYIEKVGRGWEFSFKEEGRTSKAGEPARAPAHVRLVESEPPPRSSDAV